MKNQIIIALVCLFGINLGWAQCGDSEFCNANSGLYSNDDATTIAYDNMGSAYHASFIKAPNGEWKVWGASIANNGTGNVLSPSLVNTTNYPALTGTIYKMGIGATTQLIVLTSTGLFAVGYEGAVLSSSITTSSTFQKLTVAGKTDGLPVNVSPLDVKMLFVSSDTVMITTCTGDVYVLSQDGGMRGGGTSTSGSATAWSRVMQDATTPLTNVIVSRGSSYFGYALKADGTLWTWGGFTFLGDGTAGGAHYYATQMALPAGLPGIKMIQGTAGGSYYILGTDRKVYSLGRNTYGQLGDNTTTQRTSWVNAIAPGGATITDAAWISSNEHDEAYAGLGIIRAGGLLHTAGNNSYYMIGRTSNGGTNYLAIPGGVTATDVITHCEVGGHSTALIKLGSVRYGYVGHRIAGSMGDGTSQDANQQTFDFITPPIVAVCGTLCTTPVVSSNSPVCLGQNAVFTISGTVGDIVSYKLNGGAVQTVVIGAGGSVNVTVNAPATNQTIDLTYVLGGTGSCSNALNISNTIIVGTSVAPVFAQEPSICQGQTLNPLPTTSQNGITGTWSPAINNLATTLYTFTPLASGSCQQTTTMTIVVSPAGTTPTFTQVGVQCEGEPMTALPTTSIEGITGTWSPALDNLNTTTYTFTPTASGCLNNAQMTVTVRPRTTPVFNLPTSVCSGDLPSPLPLVSDNSVNGTWSPAYNNTQTTTYTFTPTDACANTVTATIIVNQRVNPSFTQIPDICEGSPLGPLPTTSDNNFPGSWSPAVNNMATTTYTFTPTATVCATPATMTVTVIPKVHPLFASVNTLCFGDSVFALPLISQNNISGTWTPVLNTTQTTTYDFTPNANECAFPATLNVPVYADFDFEHDGYCDEGSYMLNILPLASSFNPTASSYNWSINGVTVATNALFNVTAYLNSTPAVETLPITFDITVTNENGCPKTKSIVLDNVFCGIQKGISVNNDDLNDYFDLRLLEVKNLKIFNRYGMTVYEKANYYNEWKGQSNKGQDLPDGSYFYLIEFADKSPKTGWIYLNRAQ